MSELLAVVLSVVSSLLVGSILVFVPWTPLWDANYLIQPHPTLRTVVLSAFVRGTVTGLGIVNIAMALHELALRVGADRDAIRWRRRSGCAPEAALYGPVGWPPLGALEKPSPIGWSAPLPRSLSGLAPFANQAPIEKVHADACSIDVTESSAQRGLRLVVIDIDNPRDQTLHVAVHASAAARVSLGGRELVARPFWYGAKPTSMFARAHAEAGKLRLIARVAYNQDGRWIAVQVSDASGEPLTLRAPRPGSGQRRRQTYVRLDPLMSRFMSDQKYGRR